MLSPEERYINDVEFHALVRLLEAFITNAQYTPSEMRDAVILACIHYEMNHWRSVYSKESYGAVVQSQIHLEKLRKMLSQEGTRE